MLATKTLTQHWSILYTWQKCSYSIIPSSPTWLSARLVDTELDNNSSCTGQQHQDNSAKLLGQDKLVNICLLHKGRQIFTARYSYDEVETASFFRCSMNTCKLTSSVSTWPPASCTTNIATFQQSPNTYGDYYWYWLASSLVIQSLSQCPPSITDMVSYLYDWKWCFIFKRHLHLTSNSYVLLWLKHNFIKAKWWNIYYLLTVICYSLYVIFIKSVSCVDTSPVMYALCMKAPATTTHLNHNEHPQPLY